MSESLSKRRVAEAGQKTMEDSQAGLAKKVETWKTNPKQM